MSVCVTSVLKNQYLSKTSINFVIKQRYKERGCSDNLNRSKFSMQANLGLSEVSNKREKEMKIGLLSASDIKT